MITVKNLKKSYGSKVALDNVSFDIPDGQVTGFVGPNGAGKSTCMRLIVGLDRPDSGTVSIDGASYVDFKYPLKEVGALLDAKAFNKARSARSHLMYLAVSNNIPKERVDEVIKITGLASVAKKKVKGFSLGMVQRLGIAVALLGKPKILMFDEPVNGLDPEGVVWIRTLCRELAAEGKTVFISSHLMSELSQTVDNLIIIGQGKIIKQGPIKDIIDDSSENIIRIETTQGTKLQGILDNEKIKYSIVNQGEASNVLTFMVKDSSVTALSSLIAQNQIEIRALAEEKATLENAFMKLTKDSVEYQSNVSSKGIKGTK
jgi:ABC-2 type transport system ATP-binding protein